MIWWWAIDSGSLPFYKKIIIFIFHKGMILRSRLYKINEIERFLSNNFVKSEKSITFVPDLENNKFN